MSKLRMTLGCWNYDRTRALMDGSVQPDGIELNYLNMPLKAILPWLTAHVEDARQEMGDDFWPYGLDRNRQTLATFLRYHHEQGLSKRLLSADELFAPETLEAFKI